MGRIADLEREVRTLKYQKKQMGKQVGSQGAKIYELRCQLAEARQLIMVDPSLYRRVREDLLHARNLIADQVETIEKLQDRIKELESQVLVPAAVGFEGLA